MSATRAKPVPDPRDAARKLTQAERRELESLMPKIEAAEQGVAALEAQLADPAVYAGGGESVRDVLRRLDEARAEVAHLIARWEELEGRQA